MATSTSRSADKRAANSQRASGQWLLGLLIALALVASILMVWSDQLSVPASVAVIAALWAAVLGAIGVTRFRRQAESAEAQSRDMRLVYELQLEREIAARRQYETDIEAQIRRDVAAEANHDLRGLQAQVAALRASLESMMGHELPDERVALPNERLRELSSSMSNYGGDDSLLAATDFASTARPSADVRHFPPQGGRDDLTEIIPVVEDEAEPFVSAFGQTTTYTVPVDADTYTVPTAGTPYVTPADVYQAPAVDEAYTATWTGGQAYSAGDYEPAEPAPEPAANGGENPTDAWVTPSSGTDAGGRRRSEAQHESGISAAELLSQLRSGGTGQGADPRG